MPENRLGDIQAASTKRCGHTSIETTAMHDEDIREHYSKIVRGWNTRYDLEEFIRAHGLQPLAARELFLKFGPYKADLDRKVCELRSPGRSSAGQ